MNTKRIVFWIGFLIILALIFWGLAVAINKPLNTGPGSLSTPAPISSLDHAVGPVDAPVTLIEYSDFQCPACEAKFFVVSKLLTEASTTIRFAYRYFPLPQHANAISSSMAAEAAGAQGKFWDMYDLLFTNHTDWTELADPTSVYVGYAKKIGLDTDKFTTDLSSTTLRAEIDANLADGQAIGINATPTFFINGKVINTPQTYAEFKDLIDKAALPSTK